MPLFTRPVGRGFFVFTPKKGFLPMNNVLQEYRKRPHWSFSSLNQLLNVCSLQWYFQKVEKIEPPFASVNLVMGSAYHRTLEQVYLCQKLGVPFTTTEMQDLFTEDWKGASTQQEIKYGKLDADGVADQGRQLIACAIENINPNEPILEVSEPFIVPVVHRGAFLERPLIGEFDLVLGTKTDPLVVDWKTSGSRWSEGQADKSLQATAYTYAYFHKHGLIPPVRFDITVKNKTPVFQQQLTTRLEQDWQRMGEMVGIKGQPAHCVIICFNSFRTSSISLLTANKARDIFAREPIRNRPERKGQPEKGSARTLRHYLL
jgi:hypothetical protein